MSVAIYFVFLPSVSPIIMNLMQRVTHDTDERVLPAFNMMQTVKRRFYALRNGAIASQMRDRGLNYRINFGLNIPQIKEIATEINTMGLTSKEQLDLANALWDNYTTRESRLLAPMIYPADIMTKEVAMKWLSEAQTTEIADHLCHSLLRRLNGAEDIAQHLLASPDASDLNRYAALRLLMNLLILGRANASTAHGTAITEIKRSCPLTTAVASQILAETE